MIIVRRTPTEPKTTLAGVMLETSFARFMASMATFNEETAPVLGFCRESALIVETAARKGCGTLAVQKLDERHFQFCRVKFQPIFRLLPLAKTAALGPPAISHSRILLSCITKHSPVTHPLLVLRLQCQVFRFGHGGTLLQRGGGVWEGMKRDASRIVRPIDVEIDMGPRR